MLTIGSDPEFLIFNNRDKTFVPAKDLIFDEHGDQRVGLDGNQNVGELRPHYGKDPIEHFNNVRNTLLATYKQLNTRKIRKQGEDVYSITAGSGCLYENKERKRTGSVGGHIHFGISPSDLTMSSLDTFLSIPSLFIERDPVNKIRRRSYGKLREYREQPWGFEYRVPSSWLIEPKICKGTLCLAYAIVWECKNNSALLYRIVSERESYIFSQSNTVYLEFDKGNTKFFDKYLISLVSSIQELTLYVTYQKEIDYLLRRILSNSRWIEEDNVFYNWGFSRKKRIANSCSLTCPLLDENNSWINYYSTRSE